MKICEWCQKEYEGTGKRFCGNSCSNKWKHSKRTKKPLKIKICVECKKEFTGYGKKFCNNSCAAISHNSQYIKKLYCRKCKEYLCDKWINRRSIYCEKC